MAKQWLNKCIYDFYYQYREILIKLLPKQLREKLKKRYHKSIRHIEIKKGNMSDFEKGVNLIGFIKAEFGLGHGCRLLAAALEQAGISWLAIDYDKMPHFRYGDKTWIHKIEEKPRNNTNIFHVNPDVLYHINMYLPDEIWTVPYNIGFFLWELSELPQDWIRSIELFDEIWAPSGFIVDTFKKYTDKPVIKIPYGININDCAAYDRTYFGLQENIFLFLVMFDINSTMERKNPMGAVNAFIEAFSGKFEQVGIVIKINSFAGSDEEVQKLKEPLEGYQNVYFIEKILDRDEVNGLINSADSFVSLHRSEGFGLVIAEAMYLGKPVIATNYSANIDFMNVENSCPVDYTMTKITKDSGPYKKGSEWADPDIGQAAFYMQKLVNDREYYENISQKAALFIKENLSIQKSANIAMERLEYINRAMNRS